MKKLLLLASAAIIGVASAWAADTFTASQVLVKGPFATPATELTDGSTYLIFDGNGMSDLTSTTEVTAGNSCRYGFRYDTGSKVYGTHTLPANITYLTPKHLWKATKNSDGNWIFQNVATNNYIKKVTHDAEAATSSSADDAGACTLTLNSDNQSFMVQSVDGAKWDGVAADCKMVGWGDSENQTSATGHPMYFFAATAETVNSDVFVSGNQYKIRLVYDGTPKDVYLDIATGNEGNVQFTSDANATEVKFVKGSADNQWAIMDASTEKYLGASGWDATVAAADPFYWTVAMVDGSLTDFTLYQSTTNNPGYLGADAQTSTSKLYCDKKTTSYQWRVILTQTAATLTDDEAKDAFTTRTAAKKALVENYASMQGIIGEAPTYYTSDDVDADNYEAKIAAANAAYTTYINKFNGKYVTFYNPRRANANKGGYLACYLDANNNAVFNTVETASSSAALWKIIVNSDFTVKLRNVAAGKLVNDEAMTVNVQTVGEVNGTRLSVGSNNMNVDQNHNNVVFDGWNDAGSLWQVGEWTAALADEAFVTPEISTADAPKWYRILSDRCMSLNHEPNLSVVGEARTSGTGAGEYVDPAALGANGNYWRLQAGATEGTVVLVNMVDGYQLNKTTYTHASANHDGSSMAESGIEFYLINCATKYNTESETKFTFANTYAFSTEATVGDKTCIDLANYNWRPNVNGWNPSSDGRYNLNDCGTAFYFVEATDAEIAKATEKYIAAVKATMAGETHCDNVVAMLGAEKAKTYTDLVPEGYETAGIAEINAIKRAGVSEDFTAANLDAAVNDNLEAISGKHIKIANTRYNRFLTCNNTDLGSEDTDNQYHLATVWTITKGTNGYVLTNDWSGRKISAATAVSGAIPTTDGDATEYDLVYSNAENGFTLTVQGQSTSENLYGVHMPNSNGNVVAWASSSEGSKWNFVADAVYEPTTDLVSEDANYMIKLDLGDKNSHSSAADLKVTVAKAESAAPGMRRANLEVLATLTADEVLEGISLDAGNYNITIPAGMFVKDGKMNTAKTLTVTTSGTTGITEINADAANAAVVYDLMGRRLAAPARGINIINGRKVLVK